MMDPVVRFLVRRLVRDHDHVDRMEVRARYGFLEAWVSIIGNLGLFGFKLTFGVLTSSISLVADAFHSLGDLVTSAVVLFGFRAARTPADGKHPYGHGRAEPIATLIIAILLVVAGVELMHAAVDRLREAQPPKVEGSLLVIGVMIAGTVFKEWMARASSQLGREIRSDMLAADAWHHRSDAIASALVVAALVGARFGVYWLDGVFGMVVALLVAGTGFHLTRSTVSMLIGEAPSDEMRGQILAAAASVRGVQGAHGVQVHEYGHRQFATLHVEVAPGLSTAESHKIAGAVEDALSRRLGVVPVVHVDLREQPPAAAATAEIEAALRALVAEHPDLVGFHGVHVFHDASGPYVELHIQLPPERDLQSAHRLGHQVTEELIARLGGMKVNVHVEPAEAADEG